MPLFPKPLCEKLFPRSSKISYFSVSLTPRPALFVYGRKSISRSLGRDPCTIYVPVGPNQQPPIYARFLIQFNRAAAPCSVILTSSKKLLILWKWHLTTHHLSCALLTLSACTRHWILRICILLWRTLVNGVTLHHGTHKKRVCHVQPAKGGRGRRHGPAGQGSLSTCILGLCRRLVLYRFRRDAE